MKFVFLIVIGLFLVSCTRTHVIPPSHISVNPSIEWEIENKQPTTTRTGVNFSLEWDL